MKGLKGQDFLTCQSFHHYEAKIVTSVTETCQHLIFIIKSLNDSLMGKIEGDQSQIPCYLTFWTVIFFANRQTSN